MNTSAGGVGIILSKLFFPREKESAVPNAIAAPWKSSCRYLAHRDPGARTVHRLAAADRARPRAAVVIKWRAALDNREELA
jgi:hypothetical protein